MIAKLLFFSLAAVLVFTGCATLTKTPLQVNTMHTQKENQSLQNHVMKENGTEPAFQNEYWDNHDPGIYVDAKTGEALFSSTDKFDSGTGWPSFTKTIGDVTLQEDNSLGMARTEVRSKGGHLGHWFNDGPEQSRYCMNSAALEFIPYEDLEAKGYGDYLYLFPDLDVAAFAGGCFWGVEHLLKDVAGVLTTTVGYMGGSFENPTYKDVVTGRTGHAETVRVVFDTNNISYSEVLDYFWRLHDPTQINKQGPDVGTQYRSVIFYYTPEQKKIAEKSKEEFDKKGVFEKPAATEIIPVDTFYTGEDYHQDYIDKNPTTFCHELREK